MEITVREEANITVIVIEAASMGGPGARQLSEQMRNLIDGGADRLIVDMKNVEWMNSSGLGILIGALTSVKSKGGRLCLINLQDKIVQLLKMTKLDQVFEIRSTEEEARDSF